MELYDINIIKVTSNFHYCILSLEKMRLLLWERLIHLRIGVLYMEYLISFEYHVVSCNLHICVTYKMFFFG